jgi:CHAD domain-containing protein
MQAGEEPVVVNGTCLFGAERLLPLIGAFVKEITGVRTGKDIENVHRMRVASRRLRAALPLFYSCFPERKYRDWMREIQKITRALGAARDLDVQIVFLEEYLKGITVATDGNRQGSPSQVPESPAVIQSLLSRMKRQRGALQKKVIAALDELETSYTIEEIQEVIRQVSTSDRVRRRHPPVQAIPAVAADRIGKRLLDLFAYEPWIRNSDAVAEHHAMRITAKKLRYTMEVYAPLYKLGLKKPISRIKKIQSLLGDIHDCDMWIDQVTVAIMKERTRLHSVSAKRHTGAGAIVALRNLLDDRVRKRASLYRSFVRYWEALSRSGFWSGFRTTLLSETRVKFSLRAMPTIVGEQEAVTRLAMEYPEGVGHARHVTLLALQLFDGLLPLHKLTGRDRVLLGYAGQLHDIGWKYGRKRHRVQSAMMIFADNEFPFDPVERGIIGTVTRLHAGMWNADAGGYFSLIPTVDQHRTQALAALLRIADGLDYRHLGIVQSLHCTGEKDFVTCTIQSTADAEVEKERAREKSDLFCTVFDRTLLIP